MYVWKNLVLDFFNNIDVFYGEKCYIIMVYYINRFKIFILKVDNNKNCYGIKLWFL